CMTGRRRGGTLTFFMLDPMSNLVEVSYPGYGPLATAPRAQLIRSWGDPTTNSGQPPSASRMLDYLGRPYDETVGNFPTIKSLYWYEAGQQLFWGYQDPYGGGAYPSKFDSPAMGFSKLNDAAGTLTAYGPWKPAILAGRSHGWFTEIP